jgi:hypothetical protein
MANMATTGWTSTPNVRGTFDIIWFSLQTIGLCTWTSVCPNIPSPEDIPFELLMDKFHFLLLAVLGPDLVFLLAFSQLQAARASVVQFRDSGYPEWTVRHAFYANMGGISVRPLSEELPIPPKDGEPAAPTRWPRFPVNAEQLHYLVQKGHMKMPTFTLKEINTRSKTDGLGRYDPIDQA